MSYKPLLWIRATALLLFCIAQTSLGKLLLPRSQLLHLRNTTLVKNNSTTSTWKNLAKAATEYVKAHDMESRFCFLIDMEQPSGTARFAVYDLKGDSVLAKGLVAHGRCNQWWLEGRRYSNKVGSGCTSTGKYKIGAAYQGKFGLAYKLHGLDSGNSNAFKRFVVLHAHECVPEKETAAAICQSDGCPTVSPQFLLELKAFISKANKPVLLWIKG